MRVAVLPARMNRPVRASAPAQPSTPMFSMSKQSMGLIDFHSSKVKCHAREHDGDEWGRSQETRDSDGVHVKDQVDLRVKHRRATSQPGEP